MPRAAPREVWLGSLSSHGLQPPRVGCVFPRPYEAGESWHVEGKYSAVMLEALLPRLQQRIQKGRVSLLLLSFLNSNHIFCFLVVKIQIPISNLGRPKRNHLLFEVLKEICF